ncbi:MAG: replication protein RepA [Rhodopila sp.]
MPDPAPVEPSATVHDILHAKGGRRGAAAFATRSMPEAGRRAPVDLLAGPRGPRIIAAAAETAEALATTGSPEGAAGYVYSGWCMLGLPYRRPKGTAEQAWRIDTPYAAIVVEGGSRPLDDGSLQQVGVPFGAYTRVLQIAISSECLENGSRDIELGETTYDVLRRLGLPDGGKVADSVLEQLERLARCRVSFRIGSNTKGFVINDRLVEAFEYDSESSRPFIKRLRLSQAYYDSLRRHPVAIDRHAVGRIRNSAMTLDVYCWLCYRLPVLEEDTPVSWTALRAQFGHGVTALKHFKSPFAEALELARSVYPAARFEVTAHGVVLRPSPPPRRTRALPAA